MNVSWRTLACQRVDNANTVKAANMKREMRSLVEGTLEKNEWSSPDFATEHVGRVPDTLVRIALWRKEVEVSSQVLHSQMTLVSTLTLI